jgi:hypothetical protein
MSNENPFPFNTEAIVSTMAKIAAMQGDAKSVAVLAVSSPYFKINNLDNWNSDTAYLTLFLEVLTPEYACFFPLLENIQENLLNILRPIIQPHQGYCATVVSIILANEVPNNWREGAIAWLNGEGINNQGRVRSDNIASRQWDGLLFRSQPEIHLYQAFKDTGVALAPLPVFIRGGAEYQRMEPDFVILRGGMIFVVEVDGDTVHQESPAEAHKRTTMLVHAGAHIERVSASECDTSEKAKRCAAKLLESLDKVKASR